MPTHSSMHAAAVHYAGHHGTSVLSHTSPPSSPPPQYIDDRIVRLYDGLKKYSFISERSGCIVEVFIQKCNMYNK